jgi:hypothetical protein
MIYYAISTKRLSYVESVRTSISLRLLEYDAIAGLRLTLINSIMRNAYNRNELLAHFLAGS